MREGARSRGDPAAGCSRPTATSRGSATSPSRRAITGCTPRRGRSTPCWTATTWRPCTPRWRALGHAGRRRSQAIRCATAARPDETSRGRSRPIPTSRITRRPAAAAEAGRATSCCPTTACWGSRSPSAPTAIARARPGSAPGTTAASPGIRTSPRRRQRTARTRPPCPPGHRSRPRKARPDRPRPRIPRRTPRPRWRSINAASQDSRGPSSRREKKPRNTRNHTKKGEQRRQPASVPVHPTDRATGNRRSLSSSTAFFVVISCYPWFLLGIPPTHASGVP